MVIQPNPLKSAPLQFNDVASCKRWIQSLPLTNVQAAHQSLAQQIALVRQAGIAPVEVLRIMEALREPVAYAQNELARKYAGKALPLDPAEAATWKRVIGLWQDVIDTYSWCRAAQARGDTALDQHAALIVLRCLQHWVCVLIDHHRIYSQLPGALWKKLHQLYAFAEQSGFARVAIGDSSPTTDPNSTCLAAYCRALLGQLANPFALSGRQMDFVSRWIEKWSGAINLASQPLPPSSIPALAVDLGGEHGPVLAEALEPVSSLRYIDLEPLGRTLRQIITSLKKGQTPAELGLGDDARQPGCENLLMLLYIQWCRAGTARTEARNPREEKAQVCLGMNAAHFYISGRAFRAPGASLSRQEEHDMQLFGHISERTQQMLASTDSSAVEAWDLVNQSASGFLCMMREPNAQMRISHNQLVAARRSSSKLFYLGIVQWLRLEENEELSVGIRLFASIPRPVAVRPTNFNMPGVKGFERGLLLPEIAPTPATLILPSGWFQPGRSIELHANQKRAVKLVDLLEKGADFDRCTISLD